MKKLLLITLGLGSVLTFSACGSNSSTDMTNSINMPNRTESAEQSGSKREVVRLPENYDEGVPE